MEASCANCRFGIYIEQRPQSIVVCRRYPPFPVLMRSETYEPGDTLEGFWPRVSPDDECGEHKFNDGEAPETAKGDRG